MATGYKEVPVTVRKLFSLTAAVGLAIGGTAWAEPKAPVKVDNQKLADAVAAKLKASGVVKGAKVDIQTRDGTVDLSGTVATEKQHTEILDVLKTVPGVRRIESGISVKDAVAAPATGIVPPMSSASFSPYAPPMPAAAPAPTYGSLRPVGGADPVPGLGAPPAGFQGGPPPGFQGGGMQEPVPLNGGVAIAPVDAAGPNLPPYAWPTYAPYNNYSRVAYPASYPYNAFPYIGPFYPFPKVPLGWRKVVLEWDDGHWYMGRLSTPHDQWRVRFW